MSNTNENVKSGTPQSLNEQRARRRRVNRIKMGIILFFVIWMVVCMAINIFLLVRVSSQQDQIGMIAEKMLKSTQIKTEPNASSPETNGDYAVYDQNDADDTTAKEDVPKTNEKVHEYIAAKDNDRGKDEPMTVYLTFDDGPSENTPEILKILKKHGVKATFFVTGKEGDKAKEWYKQIVAEGHTLGMHSYSHKYSTIYESVENFSADFTKLYQLLEDTTGVKCQFYRFPGGSSNQVSNTDINEFIDYLGTQGMTYYDWNVVCGDATSQIYTTDELVQNVMQDVVKYKYSVVLMHDAAEKDTTVEALEIILQKLEKMDANILPITEDSPVIHHVISEQK